jgi:hypothetical protein
MGGTAEVIAFVPAILVYCRGEGFFVYLKFINKNIQKSLESWQLRLSKGGN